MTFPKNALSMKHNRESVRTLILNLTMNTTYTTYQKCDQLISLQKSKVPVLAFQKMHAWRSAETVY